MGIERVADKGNEVVIPPSPVPTVSNSRSRHSDSNPLYDRAQLHNVVTKVRSFGENIARETKKAGTIYILHR